MTEHVPLVSIISATWGRPDTITKVCIPTVETQTYPNIEHIIVTDGNDQALNHALHKAGYNHHDHQKRLVALGRNWTGYSRDGGIGAVPRMIGSYMAAGDYVCYLDDDNELHPDHVLSLVSKLEETNADIAYAGWIDTASGTIMGMSERVAVGSVDTSSFMHRAELLKQSSWQMDGYEGDYRVTQRWIANGATYVFTGCVSMYLHGHRIGAPDQ